MLSCCLKCRKNAESKNPKFAGIKNGRITLLSKCEMYDSKNSKFIKGQEVRLLSGLEMKTTFSKIPLVGDSRYIFQKELGKACFQHDMVYRNFKDLTRRTASDEINIAW